MKTFVKQALAVGATASLLALPATPALAHHREDHQQGQGQEQSEGEGGTTEQQDDTDEVGESQHPSGRDRTDHQDRRQGNSPAEPDGDGRGPDRNDRGTDKPGDSGGAQNGDQDGNNGCGNDQDFEDDNEGWCGRNPKRNNASSQESEGEPEQQRARQGAAPTPRAQDSRATDRDRQAPATTQDDGADDRADTATSMRALSPAGTPQQMDETERVPTDAHEVELLEGVQILTAKPDSFFDVAASASRAPGGARMSSASATRSTGRGSGTASNISALARTGADASVLLGLGLGGLVGGGSLLRRRRG